VIEKKVELLFISSCVSISLFYTTCVYTSSCIPLPSWCRSIFL